MEKILNPEGGALSPENKQEDFSEQAARLRGKHGEAIHRKDGKIDFEKYEELVGFLKGLGKRYPDARSYLAFHIASGSTPREGSIEHFDFEGEDSIEKFLEGMIDAGH